MALKNNSNVKDEYAGKNQDQAGLALCALGEAISDFLRPEIQNSLCPEACSTVVKVNEGARILADLFYCLSLTRRAQITPALNLNAKNKADSIVPVDDLLFGTSFGEQMKKAVSIEKSSKEIIKPSVSITRKIQQPIKQPAGSTYYLGKRSRPCSISEIGNKEDRGSYRRSTHRSRSQSRRR